MITWPGVFSRAAVWTAPPARRTARARPARLAKTVSTAWSTTAVERKERCSSGSVQAKPALRALPPRSRAHPREPGRHRALEGKDRLLLVADGEEGAARVAGALAGEEFLRQRRHHLPLARAGVLRLVDEDVVEAAVELVMDPVGGADPQQEVGRLDDQVVEIEDAARDLHAVVFCMAASARRSIAALDRSTRPRRSGRGAVKPLGSSSSRSARPGQSFLARW